MQGTLKQGLVIAAMALGAHGARAATTCTPSTDGTGAPHVVCTTTSVGGKTLTADFPGAQVTHDTRTVVLCPAPASPVKLAQLWMPEMGHGSAETTLTAQGAGCTLVDNVQFTMTGLWQIRVRFGDSDRALVEVTIP